MSEQATMDAQAEYLRARASALASRIPPDARPMDEVKVMAGTLRECVDEFRRLAAALTAEADATRCPLGCPLGCPEGECNTFGECQAP